MHIINVRPNLNELSLDKFYIYRNIGFISLKMDPKLSKVYGPYNMVIWDGPQTYKAYIFGDKVWTATVQFTKDCIFSITGPINYRL